MKQTDPHKLKDPLPQFKFAGGAAIVGLILIIAKAPISLLAFLLAIIWLATGLVRYAKIKKWLRQNQSATASMNFSPQADLSQVAPQPGLDDDLNKL